MPELPEVENVRRSLEQLVVGKTIAAVHVRLPRIVRTPDDTRRFEAELAGGVVTAVDRRGKYLLLRISSYTLVSHLRMEGQYRLATAGEAEQSHTHVVFHFTDGSELRYRDVRQFGTMDLVAAGQPLPPGLMELGPEPFDPSVTSHSFHCRLQRHRTAVKTVLLNQTTLAGLGNIYVDEALFSSGIHPQQPGNTLVPAAADRLLAAIRDVLQRAIDAGGSSIKTYVNGYGRHGGFQMELAVYAHQGEPCPVCGSEIQKIRVGGRGTHFCPCCQRRTGFIVGLTGGIASGKSTVSAMLRKLGAAVVDADVWARRVVEPGQPALAEIADAFGSEVVQADGTLNRALLGRRVFADADLRQRLNTITHPRVRSGMQAETDEYFRSHPQGIVVWDVPLLFEGGVDQWVNATVVVHVNAALQRLRLRQRDRLEAAEADDRIKAQMSMEEKRRRADYVIDNTGTLRQTREQVRTLWLALTARAHLGDRHS